MYCNLLYKAAVWNTKNNLTVVVDLVTDFFLRIASVDFQSFFTNYNFEKAEAVILVILTAVL